MRKFPFIFTLFAILTLISCKTRYVTEYQAVEVPVIHTELRTDTVRDSVHHTDSVVVYQRGDTVFRDRVKTVTKYRDRIKTANVTDTLYKVLPKPVPVEVEKELSKWQKIKMDVGGIVMVLLGGFVIYKGIGIWKKFKR